MLVAALGLEDELGQALDRVRGVLCEVGGEGGADGGVEGDGVRREGLRLGGRGEGWHGRSGRGRGRRVFLVGSVRVLAGNGVRGVRGGARVGGRLGELVDYLHAR